MSIQKPSRSVIASHSSMYLATEARQRSLKRATPNSSICFLPLMWSDFSTSSSTGSPWVSQPPFRSTEYPHIDR